MLAKNTALTIPCNITIKGMGQETTYPVVFNNRTKKQITAKHDELSQSAQGQADAEWVNRELFIFIVNKFDGAEPTHDSIMELEDNWPGSVVGMFYKYHEARQVEVVKN